MSNELKSVVYKDIIYKYGADWTSYLESYEHWGFYWYQQKIMEGFGLVFLEAMEPGLPVIGGKVGGTAELINDGENGFLVNPGYSETLRQAIQTAVYDVELRKKVINNGYSTVKKFPAKNMVKETMSFYQEVLND